MIFTFSGKYVRVTLKFRISHQTRANCNFLNNHTLFEVHLRTKSEGQFTLFYCLDQRRQKAYDSYQQTPNASIPAASYLCSLLIHSGLIALSVCGAPNKGLGDCENFVIISSSSLYYYFLFFFRSLNRPFVQGENALKFFF